MLKEPPSSFTTIGVIGAPLKYKWNGDVAMDLDDVENDRLYDAIDASSFRAKMALASLLTELIAWRFQGHVDISDPLARVEAAWASVIDPAYTKSLEFDPRADDDTEKAQAPLESALGNLGDAWKEYVNGSIYLAEPVMKLGMLARHLMPDKKGFDAWLSATLRRTAAVFPRTVEYDDASKTYDASAERPVPRAFFDAGFETDEATLRRGNNNFLKQADPNGNSYLHSADEMRANGYTGMPYSA